MGDMFELGIIDPVKVTRVALENAVSIAALMLTTEAAVGEIPEPKQPAGAGWGARDGRDGQGWASSPQPLDWELALFSIQFAHDQMREDLADDDFSGPAREYTEAYVAVLDAYSYDVAAFGFLLVERATVAAAHADGFSVDEEAVARYVAEQQETVRQVRDGTIATDIVTRVQLEETIARAGEDRFWTEVMPQWGAFAQASQYLFDAHAAEGDADLLARWDAYQQELAAAADVELEPTLAELVSLDEVHAYLDALAAIEPI
jgi:hypothetical protein